MNDIESRVRSIVADKLGVPEEQITPTALFIEDLGADSLDSVELVMAIEEDLGVAVPDEDATKLTTLDAVVKYVMAQTRKAA